jgi:small-conductance mechanosensitive channel
LALVLLGRIWFTGFQDIGTFLGLVSAGLAIALKDLVASVAGWIYLLWRRPFEVGDRIQIGKHAGDVIDIRLFRFTLIEIGNWVEADQSTGRVILIPNSRILIEAIANYSKGFQYIWNELPVLVTFESNWPKAKAILQKIIDDHSADLSESAMLSVRKAAQRAMIIYSTLTPKVWTSVADSGVLLTIRYLCDPRKRRGTAETIWESILTEFGKCDDIDFAYPTMRRYMNLEEGKGRAGGPVPSLPVQEELK